jgi:hypothetical protein
MNVVASIVNSLVSGAIVEKELPGSGFEGTPGQQLRNVSDPIFDASAGAE